MSIDGKQFRFLAQEMHNAPEEPGVYALWLRGNVMFYGYDAESINHDIGRHFFKSPLRKEDRPDYFSFEVTTSEGALLRFSELMEQFFEVNRRLPAGNDLSYLFP